METQPLVPQPYASISRRIMALLLDGLVLALPAAIASHMIPGVGGAIVWFFYSPVLESSELRATLGKYWMGIQVVGLDGRRISFKTSIIRNFLKVFSSILLFIGYLVALFSDKKQTLHDLVAETLVVYGRNELPIFEIWLNHVRSLFGYGPATSSTTGRSSSADKVSELERLQSLREKGALSEEEFQAEKRRVLGM